MQIKTALTLLLTFGVLPPSDRPGKDELLIVGQWELVSGVTNGIPIKTDRNRISIDRLSWRAKSDVFRYKLDPFKTPKQVDWYYEGKTWRGIYEVSAHELKLCVAGPDQPRPTEFKSKQKDGRSLHIRRRVD